MGKCQTQYVGETARTLQSRISEHLGYIKNQKLTKATGEHFNLKGHKQSVDCQTKNLIYLISCKKCQTQYVGETARTLQSRISEHLGYIKNQKLTKATGEL